MVSGIFFFREYFDSTSNQNWPKFLWKKCHLAGDRHFGWMDSLVQCEVSRDKLDPISDVHNICHIDAASYTLCIYGLFYNHGTSSKITQQPCFNCRSLLWFQSAFAKTLIRVRSTYSNKEKVRINQLFKKNMLIRNDFAENCCLIWVFSNFVQFNYMEQA